MGTCFLSDFFTANQITPKYYIRTESCAKAHLKAEVCSHAAQILNNSVKIINLMRKYSSYNGKMDFEQTNLYVISVFRHEVDENCALLGYYIVRQW
jgi:hypothetical protein